MPWVRLLRDREELQTAPAGLPVFRFIMEDPGCGHGLLRVYRPFLSKDPAIFPRSLRASGSGCCRCILIPNLHIS